MEMGTYVKTKISKLIILPMNFFSLHSHFHMRNSHCNRDNEKHYDNVLHPPKKL